MMGPAQSPAQAVCRPTKAAREGRERARLALNQSTLQPLGATVVSVPEQPSVFSLGILTRVLHYTALVSQALLLIYFLPLVDTDCCSDLSLGWNLLHDLQPIQQLDGEI